jgi:hypothetical protein
MEISQILQRRAGLSGLPYSEIDEAAMKVGLEEALKMQINLVADAVNHNLTQQLPGRIEDYQTLRRKAESAGVNIGQYDDRYTLIMEAKDKK